MKAIAVLICLLMAASVTEAGVLGMTARQALSSSGQVIGNDYPCSQLHNRGDVANKWCHAGVSKAVWAIALDQGLTELEAQTLALSYFAIKEFMDIRYDLSDINTGPIEFYRRKNKKAAVTLFMDGSIWFEFELRF